VPLPTSTPTRRRGRALAAAVIAAVALPFLPGVRDWEAPARVTAAVALLTAICWMT
jgi:hypothetical protein